MSRIVIPSRVYSIPSTSSALPSRLDQLQRSAHQKQERDARKRVRPIVRLPKRKVPTELQPPRLLRELAREDLSRNVVRQSTTGEQEALADRSRRGEGGEVSEGDVADVNKVLLSGVAVSTIGRRMRGERTGKWEAGIGVLRSTRDSQVSARVGGASAIRRKVGCRDGPRTQVGAMLQIEEVVSTFELCMVASTRVTRPKGSPSSWTKSHAARSASALEAQ